MAVRRNCVSRFVTAVTKKDCFSVPTIPQDGAFRKMTRENPSAPTQQSSRVVSIQLEMDGKTVDSGSDVRPVKTRMLFSMNSLTDAQARVCESWTLDLKTEVTHLKFFSRGQTLIVIQFFVKLIIDLTYDCKTFSLVLQTFDQRCPGFHAFPFRPGFGVEMLGAKSCFLRVIPTLTRLF